MRSRTFPAKDALAMLVLYVVLTNSVATTVEATNSFIDKYAALVGGVPATTDAGNEKENGEDGRRRQPKPKRPTKPERSRERDDEPIERDPPGGEPPDPVKPVFRVLDRAELAPAHPLGGVHFLPLEIRRAVGQAILSARRR